MTNWDEIRTAYEVARAGTVSGAAEALGVHHATVIRHVDALEARLGTKLFQRHAKGYTPTEAGQDLLRVAEAASGQFAQLAGRLRGGGAAVAGDLVVTSLAFFARPLAPVLVEFQDSHPDVVVRFLASPRLFRLEYGEAHVAIRAGREAPAQPDFVVQPLLSLRMALVASDAYLARHGPVDGDLSAHRFVAMDDEDGRSPYNRWLAELAPRERATFRVADDDGTLRDAVLAGAGLGFLPAAEARARADLHEAVPPRDAWTVPLWIVTHVDLHRTPKLQAFLALLKERARGWEC